MLQTVNRLLIFVIFIVLSSSIAAVWLLLTMYDQTQQRLINEFNHTAQASTLALECQSSFNLWQLKRTEQCQILRQQRKILNLQQEIRVRPWRLYSHFTLTPIYKGQHLTPQQGDWSLPLGGKRIQFQAATTDSLRTNKLTLAPWKVQGWLDLTPPFYSHLSIAVDYALVNYLGEKLQIDKLLLGIDSHQQQTTRMVDRSQIQLARLKYQDQSTTFTVRDVQINEANLLDNQQLSMLCDVSLRGLRISTASTRLRASPSQLSLYFDELNVRPATLWHALNYQHSVSNNVQQLWRTLNKAFKNNGGSVRLEQFRSDFAYEERAPDAWKIAGDIELNGRVKQPRAGLVQHEPTVVLNVDVSQSLLIGPHAELMQEAIRAGWIYQRNQRLVSRLLYHHGKLMANGQQISAAPLWPQAYSEDH